MPGFVIHQANTNTITFGAVTLPNANWLVWAMFRVPEGVTGEVNILGETAGSGNRIFANMANGTFVFRANGASNASTSGVIVAGNVYLIEFERIGTQTFYRINSVANTTKNFVLTPSAPFTRAGSSGSTRSRVDLYGWGVSSASVNHAWSADGITSGTTIPDSVGDNDALLENFAGDPWGQEATISSITTPMVSGAAFSGACVGVPDGIGTLTHGSLSMVATVSGNAFSGTVTPLTDGQPYPFLPAVGAVWTLTVGGVNASIASTLTMPAGYDVCRNTEGVPSNFAGIINDPTTVQSAFVAAGNALTTSDRGIYPTANGMIMRPDTGTEGVLSLPHPFTMWVQRASGYAYSHSLVLSADGEIEPPEDSEILSVGIVRIGGTAPVAVSGFGTVNAGTLDGKALTAASNTSITMAALADGVATYRPGTRELYLTDGTDSDTINVPVSAPSGWGAYTITGDFVQAINGVAATYLPVGWASTDFILYPLSPSSGKTTTVGDAGVVTGNVGTQELFLVDAATGMATAFDVVTTAGAGSVGIGGGNQLRSKYLKGAYL